MFHDAARFSFAPRLCEAWPSILAEYRGIARSLTPWPESKLHDGGWKVFGLFDFPHGDPIAANLVRCPVTADLVRQWIPWHGAAGFSILSPHTSIAPHHGYAGSSLRLHLGLSVPDGDCALRVGGEIRPWRAGEALIFDDRFEHEAWNRTPYERVVLLIDFPDGEV